MTSQPPHATVRSHGVEVELAGLEPGEHILAQLRRTGRFYEADLLDAIARLPWQDDAVCVDVGANLGNHTIYLAAVLGRRVVAIEPEPRNAALLRANVARNGLEELVDVVEVALGDQPGRADLVQRTAGNAGTFMTVPGDRVAVVRLDEVVADGERIGLLKLDVEGDEAAVLRGAAGRIARDRPIVAVEAHTPGAVHEITGLLEPLGYAVLGVHGRSDNLLLVASHAPVVRLEPAVVAHDRATERAHQRAVLEEVRRLPERLGGPALAAELERRGVELERLRAKVAALETRAEDEATFARRTATSNKQLRRETELWRDAYDALSRSRAHRVGRAVRAAGARVRLLDEHDPTDATSRARRIRRAAATDVGTPTVRPPRSRGLALRSGARPPVRLGIASMPSRVEGLRVAVASLRDQVDELCVHLNGYPEVPDFLDVPGVTAVLGEDVGDRGKFAFVDGFEGYYLTADDDIAYPPYYVEHLIDGIERYGRRAVVGWHGSVIKRGFEDYYEDASRWVLSFSKRRAHDTPVHLVGTGCSGFHTATLRVRYADFTHPNVADVHLGLLGQHQRVPFVVLRHPAGAARPLTLPDRSSISEDSMARAGHLDVRDRTNRLVRDHGHWRTHRADPLVQRPELRVAIIGRVDTDRWRKGGIVRSCHLTADMLARFGVEVELVDLVSDPPRRQREVEADVVLIYPGDPDRPDFAPVEALVSHHAAAGRLVLVNLAFDARRSRTRDIVRRLRAWDLAFPGRVRLLVFSDEVARVPELGPVRSLTVALPKTLRIPPGRTADFTTSAGIFLGDLGKLCEESLFDHPVEDWIAAIRAAVPEAPLFALSQYEPRIPKDLGVEVRPYVDGPLDEDLAGARLMVSPFRHCTFEMVPVELAGAGVPVVYREMEQSLSAYLGAAGVPVGGPDDLAAVLPTLYRDPSVWAGYSRAGQLRARSTDQQHAAAALYLRLTAALDRARAELAPGGRSGPAAPDLEPMAPDPSLELAALLDSAALVGPGDEAPGPIEEGVPGHRVGTEVTPGRRRGLDGGA